MRGYLKRAHQLKYHRASNKPNTQLQRTETADSFGWFWGDEKICSLYQFSLMLFQPLSTILQIPPTTMQISAPAIFNNVRKLSQRAK